MIDIADLSLSFQTRDGPVQALSKISSGADCLPELRAALEKLAGTAA